jgi:hypothetical protein
MTIGTPVLVHLGAGRTRTGHITHTYADHRTYGVRYAGAHSTNVLPSRIVTPLPR